MEKPLQRFLTSEKLLPNVEGLNDARTPLADFFKHPAEVVRASRDADVYTAH